MFFHTVLVFVTFFTSTLAQSSTSTSSAPASTHTVSVGADGFNFSPNELFASIGDIIEYRFYPLNHSVARSSFGNSPCIPYEYTGVGRVGFWSGFQPLNLVLSNPPTFHVRVNDTEPIFFYCAAPQACLDGMIGVINPNASETLAQQFAYTQNATIQFAPGQNFPVEGTSSISRTTTATGATYIPTPVATSPTAPAATTTSSSPPPAASEHHGLSTGAIAGIAIGGFAIAVLIGALIYMCGRQRTVKEILRQSNLPSSNHNSYQPASPGVNDAYYQNMQKTPQSNDGRFSPQVAVQHGTETERQRSMSPEMDERSAMMGRTLSGQVLSPGLDSVVSPNSTYYKNPGVEDVHGAAGLIPYNPHETNPTVTVTSLPARVNDGPHEMSASPTAPTSDDSRPFSWQESVPGYHQDEKSKNMY